ncbi:MAG TPA: phosphatase PAP2 family protein [Firmicutes bacterium]|nr:phosphatase PAP2 family protein [Bacillota bacterium]
MELLLWLDNGILDAIQQLRCGFLDRFFPLFTRLGDHGWFYILVAALLLLIPKTRRAGLTMAIALIFCLVCGNLLLKPLVARVRPYDANGFTGLLVPPLSDFSFPSGHTFGAFAVAVSLLYHYKRAGIAACAAAALMAFSRLYLYVHYPSDVLGGILLGSAAAFVAHRLVERLYRKKAQSRKNT